MERRRLRAMERSRVPHISFACPRTRLANGQPGLVVLCGLCVRAKAVVRVACWSCACSAARNASRQPLVLRECWQLASKHCHSSSRAAAERLMNVFALDASASTCLSLTGVSCYRVRIAMRDRSCERVACLLRCRAASTDAKKESTE